jgi:hypothetical protein
MSPKLSSIINFSGLAADRSEWLRVARVLFFVVAVPLIAMVLACEWVAWNLGEDLSPEEGARRQTADPRLLWDSVNLDTHYRFKLARVEQVKPDVLALGQSRMGNLRSEMFAPYKFYNMFRPSWPFSVYTEMLHRIPKEDTPKVIIISMDFFMFNPEYSKYYDADPSANSDRVRPYDRVNLVRKTFIALARDPLLIFASTQNSVRRIPAIGVLPNFLGTGYRADGSGTSKLRVGPKMPVDYLEAVKWNHDPSFDYCDAMQPSEMAHLDEFAKAAHDRGIAVIAVQMPIFSPVLRAYEADGHFGILADFREHLADGYFDRLGIVALDYSDFPPYTNDSRYFNDAVHPTEVLAGAVVLKMASDPRVKAILPALNTSDLQSRVQAAKRNSQYDEVYP